MFEKISNAAERLATNVSESRRGFLVRIGQAALGATGVVAGLLALPTEAQARPRGGYCQVFIQQGNIARLTGNCVCPNPCAIQNAVRQCQGFGTSFTYLCGYKVALSRACACT